MRTSATSKIASSASIPLAQGKANAGKADGASPFALLMDMVAPKDSVKDSGKPPQKDTSNSSNKPADDKSAANAGNANQANSNSAAADQKTGQDDNTANTTVQGQAKSTSNSKAGKQGQPEDEDNKTKADDAMADANQASVLPLLELQAPSAQPPVQTAAAPTNDDDSDDMPVGNVGATAPVTPALPNIAQEAASPTMPSPKPSDLAAAQVPRAIEADEDSQSEDTQPPPPAAAQPTAQAPAPAKPTPKSATGKAAAAEKPSVSADTQIASADSGKSDVKDARAPKPDGRNDAAKDDDVKPGEIAKGQPAQANAAGTVPKADANKYAIGKTGSDNSNDAGDAAKTAAPPPQVQSAEIPDTTLKAAPQPAPTAVFAVNNIAASQAALNSPVAQAAPQANLTQHVQVSVQAAPNLPALAVEIAAKSQSGSKQFDIRLDPAELGRVDVRLSIDATGKASAHLSADQPQTLALLQKDAPALTRALRDAGLDVSQDGLNFSLRQQADNSNGNAAGSNRRGGSARNFSLTATTSIEPSAATATYRGLANGRLDIRV